MNASATMDQATNQLHSTATVHRANRFMVGASHAALERQHEWAAEAEVAWLLKQHGVTPHASSALVSLLRQRIGAALVRAGDRLLTGGLLMEIARAQRGGRTPQVLYPPCASDNSGVGPR